MSIMGRSLFSRDNGLLRFMGQKKLLSASPGKLDQVRLDDILDRFVVIGDDGLNNQPHRQLMAQMNQLHQRSPFSTLIRLGDNVYASDQSLAHNRDDGHPKLFRSRLVLPFQELLKKHVRIYSILGNHDAKNGYEEKQLSFLNIPRYYRFRRGDVEFFALDTTVFVPGYDGCYKDDIPRAKKIAKRQLAWLDKALASSTSKYKVVMGHYPLYNSGRYFSRGINAASLRNVLEPLLVKHNVDIYLCGHEHHYERSSPIYGVHHFMSGGGSFISSDVSYLENPPYPRQKVAQSNEFMSFTQTPRGLAFEVLDTQGKVIDQGLVPAKTDAEIQRHRTRVTNKTSRAGEG